MNAVIGVGSALMMVVAATGLYNLQWWPERSDYERHFDE